MRATALWRRLDTIGTDAARLYQTQAGWCLIGTAVFLHEKAPAKLDYELQFHGDWTTASGAAKGFLGQTAIDRTFRRDSSGWSVNGEKVSGLKNITDLDFGFTPATNFAQLRRLKLQLAEAVDFSVAWWEPGATTLIELPQHYRRRSERSYWYESPTVSYRGQLELAPSGFVRFYPHLWELESEEIYLSGQ